MDQGGMPRVAYIKRSVIVNTLPSVMTTHCHLITLTSDVLIVGDMQTTQNRWPRAEWCTTKHFLWYAQFWPKDGKGALLHIIHVNKTFQSKITLEQLLMSVWTQTAGGDCCHSSCLYWADSNVRLYSLVYTTGMVWYGIVEFNVPLDTV